MDLQRIDDFLEAAHSRGVARLTEPEALGILEAAGVPVPFFAVVETNGPPFPEGFDLRRFPGDRVVVKVVSRSIPHKSSMGGVRIVPRTEKALGAAIQAMGDAVGRHRIEGLLIAEYVPHEAGFGREILLGINWSHDCGPILTVGPGGGEAEHLGRVLRPDSGAAVWAADRELAPPDDLRRSLERLSVAGPLDRMDRAAGRSQGHSLERLAESADRLLRLARRWMPSPLRELEINPLVCRPDGGLVALDALGLLGPPPVPPPPPRRATGLGALLEPREIALIGVSRGTNPGRVILRNTLAEGFPRDRVIVVKPGEEEIDGCRCVPDLASLPRPVDLLVVAVAAPEAARLVAMAAAENLCRSIILIPGGFEEKEGAEGPAGALERALAAARARPDGGPLINGGNCLGIRSIPGRYDTLFIPEDRLPRNRGTPVPLALVGQSGAHAVALLSRLPWLNPRFTVTLGNQVDLTAGDFLEALVHRDDVRLVGAYIEGFRPLDGLRFFRASRRLAARGGSVILYKAARTPPGIEAGRSHTASISGDFEVARGLSRQAGVVFAETLRDFEDLVGLFVRLDGRRPAGRRLAVLSNAGFECVAAADRLGGFELANYSPPLRRELQRTLASRGIESIVNVRNPLDLTPMADGATYEAVIRSLLLAPEVDSMVVGCVPMTPSLEVGVHPGGDPAPGSLADVMSRLWAESTKPWLCVVDAGAAYNPLAEALERRGVPVLRKMDHALGMLNLWRAAVLGE
jgi:acyl-CoA synthetase (NDP forming)